MNDLKIFSQTLEANKQERTISGLLLPWNEVGHTSAGSVMASKGTLTIPDINSIFLNLQHQKDSRVGRAVSLEEREDGLHATFRISNTNAGNDLFEEVKDGLRAHLSIEISNPIIKAGKILAGLVSGAASVCTPAFKSAAVYSLTASDCGITTPEKETPMEINSTTPEATEVSAPVQSAPIFAADSTKTDLGKLTFEAFNAGGATAINAALADLVPANDAGKAYIRDQEVGALFTARKTERKLVEAVGVKPLSSLFVTGTKKNRTFAVRDWNGSKAELPTGSFTTSRENWQATPKAVAIDIAMELIEFGGEEVISDLYEQALDSYIEQTESELTATLLAEATVVNTALAPIAAVNRAASVLGGIGARMDFIVASPDVFAELQEINSADAPWWLASQSSMDIRNGSVNVGGVTLTSNNALPNNTVLVGDSRAVDYRESKDFRYRALDVAHGGVDVSFIKFRATKVTDAGAILKFTTVGTIEPVV